MYSAFAAAVPNPEKSALRSAPAEKSSPSPMTTRARWSEASKSSSASASSVHPIFGIAFFAPGDDMVTQRTDPRSSIETKLMGGSYQLPAVSLKPDTDYGMRTTEYSSLHGSPLALWRHASRTRIRQSCPAVSGAQAVRVSRV